MDTAFFDHAMDQFPCVFDELLHAYPLRPGSGNITPPCRNFSWRMRPQHACGDQTWPGRLPPLKWRFLALQKDKTTFNLLWSHVVPLVLHFFGVPIYIYIHNNPGPETILITYNYKYIYIYSSAPSKRAVAAEDKTSATAPDTSRLGLEIPVRKHRTRTCGSQGWEC